MSDHHHGANSSAWIYFLGIVGAAVYYVQHATSVWGGILGVLKALVWPAMLIYKAFELMKM